MTNEKALRIYKRHRALHDSVGGQPSDQYAIDFNRPGVVNEHALLTRKAAPAKSSAVAPESAPVTPPKKSKRTGPEQGELF